MNIYAAVIIITIIVDFAIDIISSILNLKSLSPELPEEFSDVFDKDKYRRAQEYTIVKTKFGFIADVFDLILIFGFWFLKGFNYLDNFVRGITDNPILAGLLYIGILLLLKALISLPFSIYSTFIIEERFGFNKTTVKTFILDLLKGLILSSVIGGIILSIVLGFFLYFGNLAWLYAWIAVTIFSLIMTYIAPTLIMPIFNKFTPLEDGELREKIFAYAKKVGFPLQNVFVMDGSKRSSKTNAFFTGFGKNKRIVLYDTLIEKHTPDELVAVLAHEIGHYKKKHILIGMLIGLVHSFIMFYLLSIFLSAKGLFDAFFMEHISVYAGLLFFGLLYTPIESILSVLFAMLSRRNEFQADEFAVRTIEDPNNFIDALKRLSAENLSNLTPHPFYVFLNYSHPPVLERIRHCREVVKIKGE